MLQTKAFLLTNATGANNIGVTTRKQKSRKNEGQLLEKGKEKLSMKKNLLVSRSEGALKYINSKPKF